MSEVKTAAYKPVLTKWDDLEKFLTHADHCCYWAAEKGKQKFCDCGFVGLNISLEFDSHFVGVLTNIAHRFCSKCKQGQERHEQEDGFYHKKWEGKESSFSEYCEASPLWWAIKAFSEPPPAKN